MAKKLTKPMALFFTVFAVLVAALLHLGALDLTTSAAWDGTIAEKFDGDGDGSKVNPFKIANGEQLAFLAQQVNSGTDYEGKFFKLTADIDLGGKEWTPIGGYYHCFKGTFDGDGHTVSNFTINSENTCTGLFGKNNGTIMNLGVENAEINGYNCAGGVCGGNYGTIKNCYNTGAVKGDYSVGGVCGYSGGTIKNCYSTDAVKGERFVGGVCGFNDDGCTIQNCYSTGAVSGNSETSSAIGGVCGCNNEGTITNCYYNKDIFASSGIGDGEGSATGLTTSELCSTTLPTGFDKVWESGKSSVTPTEVGSRFGTKTYTYPSLKGVGSAATTDVAVYNFGTSDSPEWQLFTEITTKDQFMAIGEDDASLGKNYVLGANIDLGGEKITPIGDSDKPFKGKFSGDGHTVSNFTINKPNDSYIGLFGYNEGTIMNLGVENAKISGYRKVGGVCGYNEGGTIDNCYNTAAVSGTSSEVGGVCGYNEGGTIQNCYNTGAVSGNGETNSDIGGVCGYNYSGGTIKNCYNTGAVSGYKNVGGVCGFNWSTITICYNTGTVSGTKFVGGVCGCNNEGTITNCYYNKDIFASSGIGDGEGSATGLTTLQMTDGKALETMGFDKTIWEKKPNNTTNGIAYYPSLKESGYQPSVEFTKKLEFEQVGDKTPVYGDKIEFRTKALITFKNAFGGENITVEDTAGVFEVKVDEEILSVTDNKFEYTAKTVEDITFTLIYNGSEYFPAEASEDFAVTIEKKELTAADFDVAFTADLTFDNEAKAAKFTTALDGVGEITVKYYDSSGELLESAPVNAGTYTVKIAVSDGKYCKATAADLTSADWKFTIAKAAAVTLPDINVSYSWATDGDVTIPVAGLPENMGLTTLKNQSIDSANAVVMSTLSDSYADGEYTFHLGPNTADAVGKTGVIEVQLTSQNYERITFSVKVTLNNKGNQEAPDSNAFDVVFTNDGNALTATIKTELNGVEYSFDEITWGSVNTLTVGHNVSITAYIRLAETDELNASPAVSKTVNSGHGAMIHHEAVEATCQHDGNTEYWECKTCAKYYSDEAAATEIELAATVLAKTDHKWLAKYESSKDGHWHKCEYCDEVTEMQSHISSGEATSTSAEYCTECGYIISPKKNGGSTSGGHYSGGSGNRDTTTTDTNPSINGTEKTWTDIAADLSKQNGGTASISLNGVTTIPADVIKAIADNKITVEFVSDSSKSWIIDGAEITTVSAVDLSMLPGSVDTGSLRGVTGVKFKLNANIPADLKVAFKNQYAGEFANIYKLTDGKLKFQNCVKVATDGTAVLPDMTAGEYAVMLCKFSDRPGDINNDGVLDLSDALSLLRYSVGLEKGENTQMGDFNGDGKIDLADALAVLRWSVGLTD